MVRIYRLALVVFISLSLTAALSAQDIVFNTQEFAPFSYMEGAEVSGPAADIIRAVCKEAGIPCHIALLPWARAQQEVAEGKAHALFLIGWNAERAKTLWQSLPVVDTEYGFFVRTGDPLVYKGPEQLKGRTVAVYGPSNTSTALDKIKAVQPDMTVDLSPEDDAVFRKLDAGRVGAAFSNRDVGLAIIKRLGLKNVQYAGRSSPLKYYIGFSKESVPEKTVKAFNEAYKKLLDSGAIVKILKAYGMVPASLE